MRTTENILSKLNHEKILTGLSIFILFYCFIWLVLGGAFYLDDQWGFTLFDDAMISMRYAYNLAQSRELIWSPSMGRVEGFTNFGWVLLMAIAIKISNLHIAPLIVSCFSFLFLLLGIWVLGLSENKFSKIPLGIRYGGLAGSFSLLFWSIRGFEVSLIFLLLCGIYASLFSSQKFSKAILATLVLIGVFTRDDFFVTTIIFLILLVLQKFILKSNEIHLNKIITIALSAFVSIFAKTLMRLAYFGEIFPNTYYLKVYGHERYEILLRGLLANLSYILTWLAPIILVIVIVWSFKKNFFSTLISVENRELTSHLLVSSLWIYSLMVGGDAWEWSSISNRFISPSIPFLILNLICFLQILLNSTNLIRKLISFRTVFIFLLVPAAYFGFSKSLDLLKFINKDSIAGMGGGDLNIFLLIWYIFGLILFCLPTIFSRLRSSVNIYFLVLSFIILVSPYPILVSEFRANGNLLHIRDDSAQAVKSLTSVRYIPSGSKVVSGWAGTFPYYRPDVDFIDPWGKMDKYIAKIPPKWPFFPGHTKWDTTYTLSTYKPDFIIGNISNLNKNGWLQDSSEEYKHYYQLVPGIVSRKNSGED